jgi:segregation and condensation protein A
LRENTTQPRRFSPFVKPDAHAKVSETITLPARLTGGSALSVDAFFARQSQRSLLSFPVSDSSSSTVRQRQTAPDPEAAAAPADDAPPSSSAQPQAGPEGPGDPRGDGPSDASSAPRGEDGDGDDPGQGEGGGSSMRFQLEKYEGPLDLLLDLIRSQKINIYDIPIAQITAQYLDYLRQAKDLSIDLGGEFVFMAATLIHIKSKMLLPKDPSVPEDEHEDPREGLVQRLLDHEKFLQAAQMLREKRVVEENVWSNPPLQAFLDEEEDPGFAVTVFDLVKTFEKVLERYKSRPTYQVGAADVSVRSRIEYLRNRLLSQDEPLVLLEVFERQPGRRALLATFLAVLEMVRMQAIILRQSEEFGEIQIRKHKMFDVVFSTEEPMLAAEGEYQE